MAWMYRECDGGCGKEAREQVYGKVKNRDWKFEQMKVLCEECREKEEQKKKEEREKANKEAAHRNECQGLPQLEGSEKQIAWAESIRRKKIERIEEVRKEFGEKFAEMEKKDAEKFLTETSASRIIGMRYE